MTQTLAECDGAVREIPGGKLHGEETFGIGPQVLIDRGLWFETSVYSNINHIKMLVMLINCDPLKRAIEFDEFTFQLRSVPSFVSPHTLPVIVRAQPEGWVELGEAFTYDLQIDVSSLPQADNRLAFRPVSRTSGVVLPDRVELVSAEFSCI